MEIKKTKDIVLKVLIRYPKTRDSDELLNCYVLSTLGISCSTPFNVIMKKIHNNEIPSLETIGRCRRKIQESHIDLRGTNYKERQQKQEDYKELAREKEN